MDVEEIEWVGVGWSVFVWLRVEEQMAGLCEPANETFDFHKVRGVVCIVELLLAFHD
jgi:hypothetical protein